MTPPCYRLSRTIPAPDGQGSVQVVTERADRLSRRSLFGTVGTVATLAASGRSAAAVTASGTMDRSGVLHAGDFGVVGAGDRDETAAVQRFLDHCAAVGAGVADFGTMRVRISGPLRVHSVGIVFASIASGAGADAPGFYPFGAGYTALTVTGAVMDFAVGVYGPVDGPKRPDGADGRARINGIQFGAADSSVALALSYVRHVRVHNLAGFGVRYAACWDTTFINTSVEMCGTAEQPAFDVVAAPPQTCNECVWVRVQVERATGQAISVSPLTLSCVFTKIHSERVVAVKGRATWQFGGACEYGSVRLHASNPDDATAHFSGNQGCCTNLRSEGPSVSVDATGGTYRFDNPGVTIMGSSPNQNGRIIVTGGRIGQLRAGAHWLLIGTEVGVLKAGFMPEHLESVAQHCTIERIEPGSGQTSGTFNLHGCEVGSLLLESGGGKLRRVALRDGTRLRTPAGGLIISTGVIEIDAGATIVGDTRLAGGALRLRGTIEGDLRVDGPCHALAGDDAQVAGKVSGWSAPVASPLLGALPNGTRSKNLAPTVGSGGWIRAGNAWIAQRN